MSSFFARLPGPEGPDSVSQAPLLVHGWPLAALTELLALYRHRGESAATRAP